MSNSIVLFTTKLSRLIYVKSCFTYKYIKNFSNCLEFLISSIFFFHSWIIYKKGDIMYKISCWLSSEHDGLQGLGEDAVRFFASPLWVVLFYWKCWCNKSRHPCHVSHNYTCMYVRSTKNHHIGGDQFVTYKTS